MNADLLAHSHTLSVYKFGILKKITVPQHYNFATGVQIQNHLCDVLEFILPSYNVQVVQVCEQLCSPNNLNLICLLSHLKHGPFNI